MGSTITDDVEPNKDTDIKTSNVMKNRIRPKTEKIHPSHQNEPSDKEFLTQKRDETTNPRISLTFFTRLKETDEKIIINQIETANRYPTTMIVKFNIDKEVFATMFKVTTTIEDIKNSLCDVLELDDDLFTLKIDDVIVDNSFTLSELGYQPPHKVSFEIVSLKGKRGKAEILAKVKENVPTLEVITVHLGEDTNYNNLVVEIENKCCSKEWLGGYRNKLTNIEYHHAECQTCPKQRKVFDILENNTSPLLYHRDTQTPFKPKEVTVSTGVNKATQMWRPDLFIASKTDKIRTASIYHTYEDMYKISNNENAVLIIQRAVRNWIHGKKIRNLINLQKRLRDDMKKQKLQILKEQADKTRAIITSAAYPVKRDDFYMLYLMVGSWWKKEWKNICELRFLETKKSEAVALLQKEVKLLESIERHRIVGKQEALKKEKLRFLEQTSRPITFKNSQGQMTSIDDISTQRAREFKELYSALLRDDVTPDDRIDVLITLKTFFVSHFMKYEYATDLISLIEREIDLLAIGTKINDLRGLHKRIEQLYMNFLQQKEFNPKAATYRKTNMPKTLHTLFQCSRCQKLLPASKYPVHVRMKEYAACKSCVWLQNIGHERVDMSPYLKLLKHVQNSEMQKCCYSAVCFILQPIGMCYLTNVIWHGHSAISECPDMSKLQHIRWLPEVEWAPWNTILLTGQEAKCHTSIPDIFEFYDKSFIETVRQKHILARQRFIPLLKMDHDIRTSGVWSSITDSGPFLHPSHAEIFASQNEYDKF